MVVTTIARWIGIDMGFFDRVADAANHIVNGAKASWNYRIGTKSGSIFNGSKISGKKLYPSAFDLDNDALRSACRAAYWDSTQARAIIKRLCDNVIGSGLYLEHTPVWSVIDATVPEDQRDELSRDIERRFHMWASSNECDSTGAQTFYALQYTELQNRLRDGETFIVIRYSGKANRMNPVNIQFIDPEQVCTPYDVRYVKTVESSGSKIIDGIEIDANGEEIAIHVQDFNTRKFTRIPMQGKDRQFVLHPRNFDTLGAVRGVSILGPVLHELKKIADYSAAELEAAVINAVLAAWIKPSDKANASAAITGVRARGGSSPVIDQDRKEASFDRGGLIVQSLKAGEEIVSFDTKRPNVNFEVFVRAVTKHVSASVGIPIEVLEESFNANYSASRASLLLFWNTVDINRAFTASQFLNHIFSAWLFEEVKSGRIVLPGYIGGSAYTVTAFESCQWMGAGKPSIDPLKEVNAVKIRQELGHTTGEREAIQYNNSDFSENARRLKLEKELLDFMIEKEIPIVDPNVDKDEDGE